MGPALAGIKILDLSRVLAGPWATQLLADLGAEIIKIERPGEGDDTRSWGPPWLESADGAARESSYFLSANRGKRSVSIDIANAEGAQLVARMAANCDVLVENFKVGGLKRYGLDFETLRKANPRLIYCSITGFGQTGPYAERAGYDFIVQGMGGMMSVTGAAEGEPMKAGVAIADLFTGLYAANAIQAALIQRMRTGAGQHIDVSLLDVQVAMMANQATGYLVSGKNPRRLGNGHPSIVPYQGFAASDGDITIAVGNDSQFTKLCHILGLRELANDAQYSTNAARVANRESLLAILQSQFGTQPASHWLAALESVGVPAGRINTLEQVFADPQVRHREMRVDLPHETLGSAPGVRTPIRMSGAEVGAKQAPPPLGAHTRTVLGAELGLDSTALDGLAQRQVI